MSTKKSVPSELTEDQIKFWLANTSLTRNELIEWYKEFHESSLKNKNLDKASFVKFFEKLKHTSSQADDFYSLAFSGKRRCFNI